MIELLPCPFCGGEAELDAGETLDDHVVKLTYYVFCFGCFVQSVKFPSEADAIEAWNCRAAPPAIATPINHIELMNLGFLDAGIDGFYYLAVSEARIQVMLYADGRTEVEITESGNCDTVSVPGATTTGHLLNLIEMLKEGRQ